MSGGRRIYCPSCRKVGPGVWVGYGRDWVLCSHCQRRVRWTEVEARQALGQEEEPKAKRAAAGYH